MKKAGVARGCIGFGLCVPIAICLLFTLFYFHRNHASDLVIPTHSLPVNNAYNDLVKAAHLVKAMPHPAFYSLQAHPDPQTSRSSRPTFADALKQPGVFFTYSLSGKSAPQVVNRYVALSAKDAAPALLALHDALDKPYMFPPVRSSEDDSFREYSSLRELARTAAGTAAYYEQIGQTGRAADTLLDGYEMGVLMPKGGVLLTGLVSTAIRSICARPLELLLPKLSVFDLARVASRLEKISAKQVSFADVIAEEGNSSTALYLEFLHTPRSKRAAAGSGLTADVLMEARTIPDAEDLLNTARYEVADKKKVCREIQRYYQAVARESLQPYTGPFHTPVPKYLFDSDNLSPVLDTQDFTAALAGKRARFIAGEAVLALLRIETGLYRYRAAKGHFPTTLALLARERDRQGNPYLVVIPADAFGGKALHFSLSPNGRIFLLYSIGIDLIDGHGFPQKDPMDANGGDIVAGKMWPPRRSVRFRVPAQGPYILPYGRSR